MSAPAPWTVQTHPADHPGRLFVTLGGYEFEVVVAPTLVESMGADAAAASTADLLARQLAALFQAGRDVGHPDPDYCPECGVHADTAEHRPGCSLRDYGEPITGLGEPFACGHHRPVKGCGGCDPSAIDFAIDDTGQVIPASELVELDSGPDYGFDPSNEREHFHGCPVMVVNPYDCDYCQERAKSMSGDV